MEVYADAVAATCLRCATWPLCQWGLHTRLPWSAETPVLCFAHAVSPCCFRVDTDRAGRDVVAYMCAVAPVKFGKR